MSTLFGVPPPPRPEVFEPGSTRSADAPGRVPEADPWRRRGAVALTFVAVSLLVLGNLATWMHFTALSPKTARTIVAAATIDRVRTVVETKLDEVVTSKVLSPGSVPPTSTVASQDPARVQADVAKAVRTAVASDAFRLAWEQTLATTAERQRQLGHGATPTADELDGVVATVPTTELERLITQALVADGYAYVSGVKLSLPPFVVATNDTAADHRTVVSVLDNLWWLFLLGAIACGAGAIYLASRRLRLGVFMALDAALMLIVCLVMVPLIQQVVDDLAIDATQAPLLVDGYGAITHGLVVQTVVLIVLALCTALVLGTIARSQRPAERAEPAA